MPSAADPPTAAVAVAGRGLGRRGRDRRGRRLGGTAREDLDEFVLGAGGLGEHPPRFRSAACGGVDQDGLADAGELTQEFTH